jgi:hypothetical protein
MSHRHIIQVTFIAVILLMSCSSTEAAQLVITNDGPAVIGTPITFTARYPSFYESFIYEFQDKNNETIRKDVYGSGSASFTHVYEKIPEVSELVMTVAVYQQWMGTKLWRLDSGESKFRISMNLIGDLIIEQQGTPEPAVRNHIISTGSEVNMSFVLHDPSGFFKSFDKSYIWYVNGNQVNETSDKYTTKLSPAGDYNISCYVMAISEKAKLDHHVNLTQPMTAKDPISKLTFDGKFFVPRNSGIDLKVGCEAGTGPFTFCFKVRNVSSEVTDCNVVLDVSRDCKFHVGWYLPTVSKHNLWLNVTNDVSSIFQKVEISVLDFKIEPSITFVVVPVVSTIAAIFIIVFGIAAHVQQRRRGFTVEVADFDFSARDDSDLLVKTFFQRLRDDFVTSMKGMRFTSMLNVRRRRRRESGDSGHSDDGRDRRFDTDDDGYASRSIPS